VRDIAERSKLSFVIFIISSINSSSSNKRDVQQRDRNKQT